MNNDMDDFLRRRRNILNYLSELDYALEPFYRIDLDKLKKIRKIIRDLEQEMSQYEFPTSLKTVSGYDRRASLVGLLPLMLMSKEMFRTNKSIIDFSIDVLGIKLKRLHRPSRTRIIGEILSEVSKLPTRDLSKILDKLQKMVRDRLVHTREDFFVEWDSAIRRMRPEHGRSET